MSVPTPQYLALVIEDDPRQTEIFAQALRMAGFNTETIADGQSALRRLAEVTPALVLLDLQLPGASGETILTTIRADDRLTETRVILATANPHMADSLRAESDLILIKPISFIQLRDLATRLRPPDTLGNV
ncbi:MAG: hypothetical protein Kow0031_29240 [Anaerolineae bacterium]